MQLLYGTSNPSKLQHMREILQGLDIEIIGLNNLGINIDVAETGIDPMENARVKAITYNKIAGIPTFSCDSGLYIEGLDKDKQPGVNVRRINGNYLNDEEFIEYYSKIVLNIGHNAKAKFKNAICLVLDNNMIFEYDGDDIADHFLMTSKPHSMRKPGFPMDSLSLDVKTGRYSIDMNNNTQNERAITEGFRRFFIKNVLNQK